MSEQLFSRQRPHVEHAYFDTHILRRETQSLPHAQGPEDIQCWCMPTLLAPCPHCEFGVEVIDDDHDESFSDLVRGDEDVIIDDTDDDDNIVEPWTKPCEYCHNSGLMDVEAAEAPQYSQLILVHRDT